MSSTSNSYVWLAETDEPRAGYVLITFEGNKRLCVRPVGGCSKCNSRGRYTISEDGVTKEKVCTCVAVLAENQAKALKARNGTPSYAFIDRIEQDGIKRLTEEMSVIRAEFDGIVAKALKRAEGLEADAAKAVELATSAEAEATEAKAKLEQLEAERKPLLDQMETLRKALALSADAIDAMRNVVVCKTQDSKTLRQTAEGHQNSAAAIRSGFYGARAEKLSEAMAKREAAIGRLRAKLAPQAAPEPAKATDAPAEG